MSVRHYTRFVNFGKHFLWVMLAALLLMVGWIAGYNPKEEGRRIVFTNASQSEEALQNIMENPRYQGLDADNQPYNVLADRGTQLDETHMLLDVVRAEISQHDGSWIALNAKQGAIEVDSRKLDLTGGVAVFSDTGYELRTDHAHIDIREGTAYGDAHIEGQGPAGTLEADGFVSEDRGRVMRFKGNVKVRIYRD